LDNQLRRVVALKVLIAGEDASDMAVARFQLEAEAVAKLGQHPNIVPVFDIGRQGRLQYFSMEFVDGRPLDQLIAGSEITPKRAAVLILGVCQGLVHAHEQGILHRDIKPANILIDRKGIPKITDFGLAKDLDEDSGLTQSGVTMGSPLFMSPEQANGETDLIDQRSDVYSLGASFYQMLTGSPPFEGKTNLALMQKILMEEPDNPRSKNPSVDVDLASICLKCMEKEPERRYDSAVDVAADLEAYLAGRPVLAKPVTRRRRLMLWLRRNRGFAFMTGLATLALLTALITVVWFSWVKEIVEEREAKEYERRTLATLSVLLNEHVVELRSKIETEPNKALLIEQFSKDSVREELKGKAKLGAREIDGALLQQSLKEYRAEPDLSRIAFAQKEWFRAYRFDPDGTWGLKAQVEIARLFTQRREFQKALAILERVLGQLPKLTKTFTQENKPLADKIELDALDTLFVVQTELGEHDQLRAILKRRRALRSNEEDAESRVTGRLLRAIGGTRQEIPVGKRIAEGLGYEHFEHLKLDSELILL
ncbi:MAG: serine/threonine-protein kinase, partial [Planctomycetota bacterium]|nr:serine/threonine-protein kinase [Planctomycetota bacterium]